MGFEAFATTGFSIAANHALDLIASPDMADSRMASFNIQSLGHRLHTDLAGVNQALLAQTERVVGPKKTMSTRFSTLEAISGASLAVQAADFARVAQQLHSLGGDVRAMHEDIADQGQQLNSIQEVADSRLEGLVQFASRTLGSQEKILETLASSRTVEAQQLIRQGWENLLNGFEDDAFSRFVKSLEYDNTVYLAHAVLARIYDRRSDSAAAEDHFKKASRFASSGGAALVAFAHVQYASFLERAGRFLQALAEVRAALRIEGIDRLTRGSRRMYEAELLARSGDTNGAVAAARTAITEDDSFFLAAMASEHLELAQPALSNMLVAIDQARRTRVLTHLEDTAKHLERLERLAPPDITQPLRSQAVALLNSTLLAHFDKLPALLEDASWLATACRRSLTNAVDAVRDGMRVRRDDVAALAHAAPAAPETTGTETLAVIGGLAAFISGIFFGIVVVGILERALNGPWPLLLCVSAFATAFATPIVGFVVVFRRTQEEVRVEDKALLDAATVSWWKWRATVEAAVRDFDRKKKEARAALVRAELDRETLADALASIDALAAPHLAGHPPWHDAGASHAERARPTSGLRDRP